MIEQISQQYISLQASLDKKQKEEPERVVKNLSVLAKQKDKLKSLLKKSEKEKNGLQEQISRYQKNLDTKIKKKAKLLDMRLDEQISKEEFLSKRENIDKEIAAI